MPKGQTPLSSEDLKDLIGAQIELDLRNRESDQIGKFRGKGVHLTVPVELSGELYVLHYFDGAMVVTGEHIILPRDLTAPLEVKLRTMAGVSITRDTPVGFILEIVPELIPIAAIQFEGDRCHIGESYAVEITLEVRPPDIDPRHSD